MPLRAQRPQYLVAELDVNGNACSLEAEALQKTFCMHILIHYQSRIA